MTTSITRKKKEVKSEPEQVSLEPTPLNMYKRGGAILNAGICLPAWQREILADLRRKGAKPSWIIRDLLAVLFSDTPIKENLKELERIQSIFQQLRK